MHTLLPTGRAIRNDDIGAIRKELFEVVQTITLSLEKYNSY